MSNRADSGTEQSGDSKCSRRELLCSAGRWAALGVLAGLAGFLARRTLAQANCGAKTTCNLCREYENCPLPEAIAAKQRMERKHGGK